MRRDLIKLRGQKSTCSEKCNETETQSNQNRVHPLPHDKTQNIFDLSAECHSHTDFGGALFHRIGDRTIYSDNREQKRSSCKRAKQPHRQSSLSKRLSNDRVDPVGLKNRHFLVDPAERTANNGRGGFRIHRGAAIDFEKRNVPLWPG